MALDISHKNLTIPLQGPRVRITAENAPNMSSCDLELSSLRTVRTHIAVPEVVAAMAKSNHAVDASLYVVLPRDWASATRCLLVRERRSRELRGSY